MTHSACCNSRTISVLHCHVRDTNDLVETILIAPKHFAHADSHTIYRAVEDRKT